MFGPKGEMAQGKALETIEELGDSLFNTEHKKYS